MKRFADWLQEIGLAHHTSVLAENGIDFDVASTLTEDDLRSLGLNLGDRRRLLQAIARLSEQTNPTPADAATPNNTATPNRVGAPSAERRQLTVLFCDLVGSTALAQKLDPEELRELMQAYRKAGAEVVARYEGHVAQYLGDGLMVYFGWPSAHEDDAERGVRSALEIVQAVKGVSAVQPLAVRIGVATGAVVVGKDSREDNAEAKLAVGETPNVAARVQGLAGPNEVVIAPGTRRLVGDAFELADLGVQSLKGIAEPVRLFRVVHARATESRFEAAHGGVALTPVVGREEEVALLLRRWHQACGGEGQVVLMGGEPGIGKSRLTRVLRERLGQQPYKALRYQCSPYHLHSALYPAIDQFERAAGFAREDRAEQKLDKLQAMLAGSAQQIAESAPLFAALLSLPTERYPPLKLSAQKQKEKTLEALAGQVEALARQQPLLIIYEDVHWIDATSQEALDLLVPRLGDLRVLAIFTYRPEYRPRWTDQAHVTNLGLNRLGRQQATTLVAKLIGHKTLPAEVLDQILAHTDGVPLFIEELTKSILESKLLHQENDRYVLRAPLPALAIPTTLRDSLLARLDRLAPVREVAQIGACIGREFSYNLLAAVSPLNGERLDDALEQLTEAGLVFRRGMPPDALYTFKHALVQDTAYDSLLKSKRSELHAQIARALENDFSVQIANEPELLAHHYTAAGLVDEAITYWQKAGELALQRMALKEAIAHLNKGLELTGTLPASLDRDENELALHTRLGTAWSARRGWAAQEVEACFTPALRLAKSLKHRPSYLPLLYGLYAYDLVRGHVTESLKWVREMQSAAEDLDDAELRIEAATMALCSSFYLGDLQEAHRHAVDIPALYNSDRGRQIEHITNQDPLTVRGIFGAPCLWLLGYPDQALGLRELTEAHARAGGHPFGLCWVLVLGSWVFDLRGELDVLLAHVDEGDQLSRAHSMDIFSKGMVPAFRAMTSVRLGRASEGIAQLRDACGQADALGGRLQIPYWRAVLAEGMARTGDIEQGLSQIEECLAQIERPGWEERVWLAEVLRLKGWMLQQQGKLEQAEQSLCAAIDIGRKQQAKSWELRASTSLARLWKEQGKRREAYDLLAPTYGWFTEGFDTKDLVCFYAAVL
jgi:class 3 adenylate cyclase/tetratricopeptide (TPR) repeat protein